MIDILDHEIVDRTMRNSSIKIIVGGETRLVRLANGILLLSVEELFVGHEL